MCSNQRKQNAYLFSLSLLFIKILSLNCLVRALLVSLAGLLGSGSLLLLHQLAHGRVHQVFLEVQVLNAAQGHLGQTPHIAQSLQVLCDL